MSIYDNYKIINGSDDDLVRDEGEVNEAISIQITVNLSLSDDPITPEMIEAGAKAISDSFHSDRNISTTDCEVLAEEVLRAALPLMVRVSGIPRAQG